MIIDKNSGPIGWGLLNLHIIIKFTQQLKYSPSKLTMIKIQEWSSKEEEKKSMRQQESL